MSEWVPRRLAGDKAGEDARVLAVVAKRPQVIAILVPKASHRSVVSAFV